MFESALCEENGLAFYPVLPWQWSRMYDVEIQVSLSQAWSE